MPGINLSQSAVQKKESEDSATFGKGFLSLIVILSLVVAAWVGVVLYDRRLTQEIADLVSRTESVRAGFSAVGGIEGDSVAKIADLQHRVDIIGEEASTKDAPADFFRVLENAVIPGVVISRYAFDAESDSIVIEGVADSMSLVAQEMVLLKKSPLVVSVSVDDVTREKDGKMKFSSSVSLSGSQKK